MKTDSSPTPGAISELAYRLWEQAGSPDGRSEEFWHQAENQLRAVATASPAPKTTPARRKKRGSSDTPMA